MRAMRAFPTRPRCTLPAAGCALLLALGGCVYPHVFTTQPDVSFLVRGPSGAPLPGARVVLSAIAYPPPARLYSRSEALTNTAGHASFTSTSAVEWGVPALHGSTAISWYWCAEAAGLAPRTGSLPSDAIPDSVVVDLAAMPDVLTNSTSTGCDSF
jgi:hypothetical protein